MKKKKLKLSHDEYKRLWLSDRKFMYKFLKEHNKLRKEVETLLAEKDELQALLKSEELFARKEHHISIRRDDEIRRLRKILTCREIPTGDING